jgi:hypothetical protein
MRSKRFYNHDSYRIGANSFMGNSSSRREGFTFEEGNILTAFPCASQSGGRASVSGVGTSAVPGGISTAHDLTQI